MKKLTTIVIFLFIFSLSLKALTIVTADSNNHLRSATSVTYTISINIWSNFDPGEWFSITFPAGFDISGYTSFNYADNDPSPNPTITHSRTGQTIYVNNGFRTVDSGSTITISMGGIVNHNTRGAYTMTVNSNFNGSDSQTFYVSKRPVIQNTSYYTDSDNDGLVDQLVLNFDVPVNVDDSGADTSITFGGASKPIAASVVDGTYGATSVSSLTLNLTGFTSNKTYYAALTASYSSGLNIKIYDSYGTVTDSEMANGTSSGNLVDGAAPIITDATTDDINSNGYIDQLILTYSESVVSTNGLIGFTYAPNPNSLTTTNLTVNLNKVTLTLGNTPVSYDTGDTPNVIYSSVGTNIEDTNGIPAPSQTFSSTKDGAGPIIVASTTGDSNNDGYIDRITLTYSEDVNTLNNSGFTYTGNTNALTSTVVTDGALNTVTLDFTNAAGAYDTDNTPNVVYASASGNIVDNSGFNNAAPDQTFSSTTDSAAPFVYDVVRDYDGVSNTNVLSIYFSEPINWGGMATTGGWTASGSDTNLSDGFGTGAGLYSASNFTLYGIGSVNCGSSGADLRAINATYNLYSIPANRESISIRLGANNGFIRTNGTENSTGDYFVPDINLKDDSANSVYNPGGSHANYTLDGAASTWQVTNPTMTDADTSETVGDIDGRLNKLIIDFSASVIIVDGHANFGNSTVIDGATTYTVSTVDHSQTITNNFELQLNEIATGNGDTGATPTITYLNGSTFIIYSAAGRVEMANNHSRVADDMASPVITGVEFGIDDPPGIGFDTSPFYNEAAATYSAPLPADTYDMHVNTGNSTLPVNQRTYHNTIKFVFSEALDLTNSLGGTLSVDPQAGNYDFAAGQKSANTPLNFGETTISGADQSVTGLGKILNSNFTQTAGSNFIQFEDAATLFIHIAGWHDGTEFSGHILSAGTIPTSGTGPHYFETMAYGSVRDSSGNTLVKQDIGGNDDVTITFAVDGAITKDWDIYPPLFRYNSNTDPSTTSPPAADLSHGVVSGSPVNSIEFVMSEAIRDPSNTTMTTELTLTFLDDGSPVSSAISFDTAVTKLGKLTSNSSGTSGDPHVNDQGFIIQFSPVIGKGPESRIQWTYTQPATFSKIITDLRGNRLASVLTTRTSLESTAPYIVHTRMAPGSNLLYLEFNEPVFNSGGGTINAASFQYVDNVTPGTFTISSLSTYGSSGQQFILTVNNTGSFFTIQQLINDVIRCINTAEVVDLLGNQIDAAPLSDHPVTDIGINFFSNETLEDYFNRGSSWRVTNFDGSRSIGDIDMSFSATVSSTLFPGFVPILFYDVTGSSGYWNPGSNYSARSVIGSTLGSDSWQFLIPSSDSEIKGGNELSMIPKISNYYCYRSKYAVGDAGFNPYEVETYKVQVKSVQSQSGNVTILNNVINPNNSEETRLIYSLSKSGPVSVVVYDLSGNVVMVLKHEPQAAGKHILTWSGRNNNGRIVARGVYFIRITGPGISNQIRKVLVVK